MVSLSKEQSISSQLFQLTTASIVIVAVLIVGEYLGRNLAMWL